MDNLTNYEPEIRTTFGIIDGKTGKPYPDIRKAYLMLRNFCLTDIQAKTIEDASGTSYLLSIDSRLRNKLKEADLTDDKCIPVIISFQQRDDCNIAIARFNTNGLKGNKS